jgi:glucose/arabinose dehydrogenase
VFSSAATASVQENVIGVFYRAAATASGGAAVTYAIAGGADAARFAMNPVTHEVRFTSQPDYEAPADANADNAYDVTLSATAAGQTATLALRVTVTDVKAGFHVRRVASGFSAPMFVAGFPDGSGRVVVVERAGRIRLLDPAAGTVAATDFLNLTGAVATAGEKALNSIAFSPNFAADHTFYIHVNPSAANTSEVRRYTTKANDITQADPASATTVLVVPQEATTNHKGGLLAFDAAGRLLVGYGDGGGGGDPNGNAQNRNSLLGKLLRLDVTADAFPADATKTYAIPPANPFASGGGAPEVYAMGLRNPFRGSVDPVTGDIWIGDVGQDAVEEVDLIPANAAALQNFGWNQREGDQPYNGGANDPAFILPVLQYNHGSAATQGNSVIGGIVYRGPVEDLQGQYIFGDYISHNFWSVPSSNLVSALPGGSVVKTFTLRNTDFAPDTGSLNGVVNYGTDVAGNLYLVALDTGSIFRVEPTP